MLVPPLSNESRTRNDSPVPERLFELSNLLKRTLSPADHAFALRAALEAHAMGADESAVVATAAACGLDRAGEALEPLLTLEELAAASRISVGLLNVRAVAHSSDAVADGMLALARVRIRELLDDARLHSGPDDAALEAPDEYVEPFHDILLATAGRPGAAALRDALHTWVGMLGIEPAWMQEERPAYWVIGLPGDRNLELFADVFRRLGFLFGKMPGDKGPAGLKPVQGRHVLTVSAPISKADFLRRLMTSIAARHPALFVRAMDRTREGRGLVWERHLRQGCLLQAHRDLLLPGRRSPARRSRGLRTQPIKFRISGDAKPAPASLNNRHRFFYTSLHGGAQKCASLVTLLLFLTSH